MPTVAVRGENGEIVKHEVLNRDAVIATGDGDPFSPAIVQRIEWDREGGMSQITTVCGETENRIESDKRPDITVEGIIPKSQINQLKTINEGEEIVFSSDLDKANVVVKRVTLEQTADVTEITIDGETELAFPFQLQLKYPE